MTVNIVRQRLPADCGICCMAMATNLPYAEVFMATPWDEDTFDCGITLRHMVTTLRRLGFSPRWHWPEGLSPNNMGEPLREKVRGKNGIHLVESIHKPDQGAFHYVYVNNGEIYDPSPWWKRKYRRYEQLRPLGFVYQPQF